MLGVTRQRLHELQAAGRLPQPKVELAAGPDLAPGCRDRIRGTLGSDARPAGEQSGEGRQGRGDRPMSSFVTVTQPPGCYAIWRYGIQAGSGFVLSRWASTPFGR